MHGDDYLAAISMTPFLVASFLAHERKTMFTQDANDLVWLCKRGSARSPERNFQNFCASRQIDRCRLKPKFKSFLCVLDRFVLCVAGGGATG